VVDDASVDGSILRGAATQAAHDAMTSRGSVVDAMVRTWATVAPRGVLRAAYGAAVGRAHVAMCLHRVNTPGPMAPLPWINVSAACLDELLEMIEPHHRGSSKLTLTFDDGYRDAVIYVTERAPQLPHVDWIVFVCPEKTRTRAGYRWDLHDALRRSGSRVDFDSVMDSPMDVRTENLRQDLLELGDHDDFALATVEELRAAADRPNVRLGNHSNSHFRFEELSDEDAEHEVRSSARALDELVGSHHDFAFPFGTPGTEFSQRDVGLVRSCYPAVKIWSTEGRPYLPDEETDGVLPRIPHFGDWSPKRMLAFITYCAISHRGRQLVRRLRGQRPTRRRADRSAS
jgi:peptidoglycan/xylan/chitin deacetylase (PgdA/CDA1 family)